MHFVFSHTLQIISPTVHSVKTLQKLAYANAFSHKSRDCGRAAVHSVPRLRSSSRRQMTTNPANSTTALATNALSLRSCLCLARTRCLGLCGALCVVRFFRDCGPFAPFFRDCGAWSHHHQSSSFGNCAFTTPSSRRRLALSLALLR